MHVIDFIVGLAKSPWMLLAAVVSGAIAYPLARSRWASRDWPRMKARVTRCDVQPLIVGRAAAYGSNGSSSLRTHYVVHLAYEYDIEGKPYVGSRYSMKDPLAYRHDDAPTEIARACAVGSEVDVSVDPANPFYAVVEPGPTVRDLPTLVLPILIVAIWLTAIFG